MLKDIHNIVIHKMLMGYSQADIARELNIHHDTIQKWMRHSEFREALAMARAARDHMFHEQMKALMMRVPPALTDILEHAKNTDKLGATHQILRVMGKYDDKLTVKEEAEYVDPEEEELLRSVGSSTGPSGEISSEPEGEAETEDSLLDVPLAGELFSGDGPGSGGTPEEISDDVGETQGNP
ncbi:MAG: hypothetical protein EHM36_04170 [Deltaproteobacteria bacterium]|nr:MAG: hypothetical protein EHM36_04170 [Deltaproteobacteria bacterium]